MGKYVIVVESGSDVSPEQCERYGIAIVPMHVTIGSETMDDGSIDPLEIYSRCNELAEMPKTSGCTPGFHRPARDLLSLQRARRDAQDERLHSRRL